MQPEESINIGEQPTEMWTGHRTSNTTVVRGCAYIHGPSTKVFMELIHPSPFDQELWSVRLHSIVTKMW